VKSSYVLAAVALIISVSNASATGTPQQQCQATKNKTTGKYAACREGAAAKLATSGDTVKYNAAITKCEGKFASAWQKAIDKAAAAGATCLDDPLTEGDFQEIIDEHTDNIATALGGGGLANCAADIDTVNAGTAVSADVLAGKTFSSGTGLGQAGTMPNNGAVNITPSTTTQAIAAGYHNGAGTVAGDADLIAGNIKSSVNLFGVTARFQEVACSRPARRRPTAPAATAICKRVPHVPIPTTATARSPTT
jgi:hypothetical protein